MVIQILEDLKGMLPSNAMISQIVFEGANIVLYTKNAEFFIGGSETIREIVSKIKKRIELRPDPTLCMGLEKAEEKIRSIIPKEAGKIDVHFDPPRSVVVIESEKPGLAIGKSGEVLKQIRKDTFFVPIVQRIPAIKSKIIDNIPI